MLDLKILISKLTPLCRRALERAAERCRIETHYEIEIEHFLVALLGDVESDFFRVLGPLGLDAAALSRELTKALSGVKRGNSRVPIFSSPLISFLAAGWSTASLEMGSESVRSGALLKALTDNDALRHGVTIPTLAVLDSGTVSAALSQIMMGGAETLASTIMAANDRNTSALEAYTIDLTSEASAGRIDPIVGRDSEIRQVIDVLMRRRQNNPILAGDAGVGKTAVVEGFAQRIVAGMVPRQLGDVRVHTLDLGLLQAGASAKGAFEQRLRAVIDEVTASPHPIVLFIDEAHMLIGAGGSAGQGDAANLLKPALARGALRTIAATTWGEYKRYIENDPALARRFQVIKIAEPDEATAREMLRGIVPKLERHHGVRILDEALADAVTLSHRYMIHRQLPDKAISVLDTACARVAVAQSEAPAELEDAARRCEAVETELSQLDRERRLGTNHSARIEELEAQLSQFDEKHQRLLSRWEQEKAAVGRILDVERKLDNEEDIAGELHVELAALRLELEALQGDAPLIPAAVDGRSIAEVIAGWTGMPVGRLLTDNMATARSLRARMAERIVGQDMALDTICRRIQTFYADLGEPHKPTGVFLLAGPSGVGKTETAATLADLLFGGSRALITVNMSEYQEAHSVSGLKGAPPGYVGYGKGGVLTEAVRRTPYCVLLLDEVEKAHPDVIELFYQVFDKGMLEDSDGQAVDFTNSVILLTSNVGTEVLNQWARAGRRAAGNILVDAIRPDLLKHFPPALLGRLVVVPYLPLDETTISNIVRLKLGRIQERFMSVHGAEVTYADRVIDMLAGRARAAESGARTIDQILTHTLLPDLSVLVLDRLAEGKNLGTLHIDLDAAGALSYAVRG